jgi:hypothetical protein
LPSVEPGKNATGRSPGARAGERERACEVGAERTHVEPRVDGPDLVGDAPELRRRDVHGHVRRRRDERVEQQPHLQPGPAPVLDEHRARAEVPGEFGRARLEDLQLRARQVVLGQLADPLEQRGAGVVVEELRRERLRGRPQAGEHVAPDAVAAPVAFGPGAVAQRGRGHAPLASRTPPNCQRADAG